jgi:carbon storage regulator
MLLLDRHVREILKIKLPGGDLIDVKVISVRGNKVSIGLSCPKNVKVYREEVWAKLEREKCKTS